MNTLELKIYLLTHIEDLINVEITDYEDRSFYLSAQSSNSQCGAHFSNRGRMHPMARIAFDEKDLILMTQIENVAKEFISRKAA